MNPLSLSAPLLPPTPLPLQAGAISPIAAIAFAAAEAELPLPQSQPLPAAPVASGAAEQGIGGAMRPDQVFMTRQMIFPQTDGRTPGMHCACPAAGPRVYRKSCAAFNMTRRTLPLRPSVSQVIQVPEKNI